MPEWLVDPSTHATDPWPSTVRATAEAVVARAGLGPAAVRTVLAAVLVDSTVRLATDLTVRRTRVQNAGNTSLAADDPQFVEVLRETSGLSVAAVASTRLLLSGVLDDRSAEHLEFGVRAIAQTVLARVFETLGASATLEHHGLHRLWSAAADLWSETEHADARTEPQPA